MTTSTYKIIKQHIKDGCIEFAARLLRAQERDERYTELYIRLLFMALRMSYCIGPLTQATYMEICMLNFPLFTTKGGVKHE